MGKPDTTLAKEMLAQYGPLLGGAALHQALGFTCAAAMRQAVIRNQVGVRLFNIANRRGKFALTRDVAEWLASCAADAAGDSSAQGQENQATRPAADQRENATSAHGTTLVAASCG